MGYYTSLSGELMFHPPITEEMLSQLNEDAYPTLGYAGSFTSYGWNPDGDDTKTHNLESELETLIDQLKEWGCSMTGAIVGQGEENTDIWRLIVKYGEIVSETAVVRWPDGTEYRG